MFGCSRLLSFFLLVLVLVFVTLLSVAVTPVAAEDHQACKYHCGLDCGELTDCEVEIRTFSSQCRCVPQAGPIAGIAIAIIVISVLACVSCCYCGRCCCFQYRRQLFIPAAQTTIITSQQSQSPQTGYTQHPAQPIPYQQVQHAQPYPYPAAVAVQGGNYNYPQGYMQHAHAYAQAVPMEGGHMHAQQPQPQETHLPPPYNPYEQQPQPQPQTAQY